KNIEIFVTVYRLARRLVKMGSVSAVVSIVVTKWREHPPSLYSLKVDNFKQLEMSATSSDVNYQSRLFSSGGYNWKLIVYPKGKEKDNDNVESLISAPQREVFAELIFFVYNKKETKYFTIQDLEVKRFNALKTVWGLQQVLPFDSFNHPENGFVFEGDQCEFGVDVIVVPPLTNWEILFFNEKLQNPSSLGLDTPKADEKVLAQANFRVLDPLGSNHFELKRSEVISTIVKKWREHPPSSYCLKVDNFKQLENFTTSSDDKYESRLFSSCGYNWKLIVYPKGNKKDNGKGFISMYVEIDSKSFISEPQCEVFAELIFFVYNKKENKYFTIQDVEVKRFNALKTMWGLRQVLSFDSFNNPENVMSLRKINFGVDVVVPSPLTSWEILSFNKKLQKPKFSWTVKKFSQLKEHEYTVLKLYPKGYSREDDKWLSVFLHLADNGTAKADEKIFVQANLRVLDPHGSNHKAYQMNTWQIGKNLGWGWDEFLSLEELRKAYLDKEDALNVEAEFEVVSATKYSPII
ncbi:LOW QUALITY PROTEIN: hypothetical protein HID58_047044, partial [Brassica napus]